MKTNIDELKNEMRTFVESMTKLNDGAKTEKRTLTEDENTEYEEMRTKVENLKGEIKRNEELISLNSIVEGKEFIEAERTEQPSVIEEFRAFATGEKKEFRADFTAAGNTDLTEQTIGPVSTIASTSKNFLLNVLNVPFYTDRTGNFKLPYSDDSLASMPAEGEDASTFVYVKGQNELAPKRFTATYTLSLDSMVNISDNTIKDILTKLEDSLFNKVEKYYYEQFVIDASGRAATVDASAHWNTILSLEEVADGTVFISSKPVRTILKGVKKDAGSGEFVWDGNEVDSNPAFGRRYMAAGQLLHFDPQATALAQFGTPRIIKDELTKAGQAEVVYTAIGYFDAGIANPYGVTYVEGLS